jgi:flavin reductase (DIM6/NTAB) family NADH-FMN oxidoreductase RutF
MEPALLASPADFCEAMSALASGVVVVTCRVGGRPWGMTVTAFASVSADPPMVLVSLASRSRGATAIDASGRFGVSVLTEEQLDVAELGAARGTAKFLERYADTAQAPVVAGALASLDCRVSHTLEVADHTVFIGAVRRARSRPGARPLVYHRRGYRTLAAAPTERSSPCLAS